MAGGTEGSIAYPIKRFCYLFTKSWKSSLIENYLQSLKSPRKDVAVCHYIFSDPHHGEIGLHWQGAYLWGILSLNNPDLRSKYLRLFEEGVRKRN
jgi:hypothetical protein